jgi:hypothetical protein
MQCDLGKDKMSAGSMSTWVIGICVPDFTHICAATFTMTVPGGRIAGPNTVRKQYRTKLAQSKCILFLQASPYTAADALG